MNLVLFTLMIMFHLVEGSFLFLFWITRKKTVQQKDLKCVTKKQSLAILDQKNVL